MNRITSGILLLSVALFSACANQSAPTGGEKDEVPPVLVSSIPAQGELNFKGKEIVLTFDELIKTDNPKEQFLITPRIKDEYEIKYRKNKVIIEFEKPLQDSTTYSINFREGIKDLTEGNPADTLKLAFSTGSYLDSLSLSGHVYDLMTNTNAKDVTIAIYEANDTLDVFNSPPVYYTKTDAAGLYNIDNLKNASYKIYAFEDKNKNLTLESKSEKHGFISETVKLDSNISKLNIPIQLLDVRDLELQSTRASGTTYNLKYNKHVTDYDLKSIDTTTVVYSNFVDVSHNTIQIFNSDKYSDTLAISIRATDSLQHDIFDSVRFKFEPTQRKPTDFTVKATLPKVITKTPTFSATLKFSKPVKNINYDSIYLYLDTANILYFKPQDLEWNQYKDEVSLTYEIDPSLFVNKDDINTNTGSRAQSRKAEKVPADREVPNPDKRNTPNKKELSGRPDNREVPKNENMSQQEDASLKDSLKQQPPTPKQPHFYTSAGSFISAESDSSKRIKENLSFVKPDQLGVLLIEVQTDSQHYFVQLINTKNQVVAEEVNGKTFQFKNIEPGEYRVRILVDSNLNGIWDPGNVKANEEPEPIIFYQNSEGNEILTLRANWELGPNVISF
ncbi:Ig-like domain-containing protein [Fulvivirga ulvae]|uniref:Ig-like domain-containing protein n=1 Tax=Fulvivirga ulvae TaxID=2904245 RepID=UPI001F389328|nr:Ig-like domain-containing protein [Fulvivirga ulvae]UII33920.1 Ig-like domain-containing protein [Fulvivirga ulvae]